MKSNRFVKSILSIVSALLLVWGVSCSNTNILDTTAAEISSSANDKSEVIITFSDMGRGWVVDSYEVEAINSATNVSQTAKSSSSSVVMKLTTGDWTFIAKGYDAGNTLIYKGKFECTITDDHHDIQIMMVKKSGSMTYNIAALAADAGSYTSIKIVASKDTFSNVISTVNSFSEKAVFTGLAEGEWTFKTYTVNGSTETLIGTEKYDIVPDAVVNKVSSGNPIKVTATPVINPTGGVYTTAQNVTIACSEPATIYYTTDGSKPTTSSSRYLSAIPLSDNMTIKAIAVADGKSASNVVSATYTFVSATTTTTIVPDPITDKIILHAYGYTTLYAWKKNTEENYTGKWPGKAMEKENDSWYTYTLEKTSAMVIFSNNGGSQTADLEVAEAGEYWYKNNQWYTSNPDDAVAPTLKSFTADKTSNASGNVTLTVSATDNTSLKNAKITLNGKDLGSIDLSGTSANGSYTWDTTKVANDTYTLSCVVYDGAGNASAAQTLTVSTKNTFTPKAVISGPTNAMISSQKEYSAANSVYLGDGAKTYLWTISGATPSSSTSEKVTITFPSSETTVTVKLKVTADGKSDEATQTVRVVKQSERGDFREETIYFLMTTRFYDGDSNNNEYCWDEGGEYLPYGDGDCAWRGDFKGIRDKLDYIKALGFSAIWITPVVQNSSGIDYHGYHAYDFKTVDPRYESSDYKYADLIADCHDKGIKVIQDIVLNHTGNFGEKNIFGMFKKDTVPYINKDHALPSGAQWNRSPFYSVDPNGYAYSKLMAGLAMQGGGNTIDAYNNAIGGIQYGARINAMKEDSIDTDFRYHHAKMIDWNSENCQLGQMAGDCVDLNTENPTVFEYLKEAYCDYINMGVDAFRIDTVKHISRLTFNKEFIPAFMEAGGDNFYIFGETCARYRGRWNEGVPALSPSFYTWKEDRDFAWSKTDAAANSASATAHFGKYRGDFTHPAWAGGTANHLLNGNNYHEPDYSMRSHLDQIDFPMHWAFNTAGDAFNTAVNCNDPDFNDATWNVTYVDSHDYAPDNAPENKRFNGYWPDKMNLLWTFRGIPCIYYGSEIEFMKGCGIDPASERIQLNKSGRAYFGDNIEGSVNVTDYGKYSGATGKMAETLNHPLAKHVQRLNLIRRAIPALQKGQYSVEGCFGNIAFKRRYTKDGIDSFALVAINGQATFSGVPSGSYVEVITGKTVSCSGSLTSDAIGDGNMRVYVLKTSSCTITGKIGEDGTYLK